MNESGQISVLGEIKFLTNQYKYVRTSPENLYRNYCRGIR